MTPAALLALTLATALPGAGTASDDTLRSRTGSPAGAGTLAIGAVVPGYLSPRGLPPVPGEFVVTDSGLVFRSSDGRFVERYPLVGRAPAPDGGSRPIPTVSLAYVDQDASRTLYVFRLSGGVFQTETPGALLEAAEQPDWVDEVPARAWPREHPLVAADDAPGIRSITERSTRGPYADTLYALFGRPSRPVGQVDERGRRAGRLGEFLATRDSLSLDPARMTSEAQLRHTLAHELAHRWQARASAQLDVLWKGVPPIRDPRRYGQGSASEHQAEAIAFAVHFLQATAAAGRDYPWAPLLDQYERMVPGTGVLTRYLALQPIYAGHPLRRELTGTALR